MTAIDNAIRVAGSANKLACTIGVSGMAVSQWKAKGTVPSSRVLQVFSATGVRVAASPSCYREAAGRVQSPTWASN
ncbi:helix-turn-helix domain-containing protein [Citrobacter freundii]|jgi:DNA-binding transcriptional regulator YdaS (Cro superfamily)|uniref:Cro/CI family transcriptional regulator n=1 Tax=Citrobacter freundii TaxID=546 RepID=UPI0015EAD6C4|nr:Cro/CI family transcriptional regulator [Citrobacter freundii]QLY69337.1 helix-turn-helix domain-containing protein [Citrobacter freundii]